LLKPRRWGTSDFWANWGSWEGIIWHPHLLGWSAAS
jgi:hypothetical protein